MESLVAKRNSLFERVKRELDTANRVKAQNPSLSEVRDRLDRLQQLGNSFFIVQDEIEDTTPQATRSTFDYRKEFEDRFYAAKTIYADLDEGSIASDDTIAQPANSLQAAVAALLETQRVILSNQANHAAQLDRIQQGNQQLACQAAASQAQPDPLVNVRLPPISIPIFTGERKDWRSFKDLFVSTIHNQKTLQPSQKLQYLKSFLDGEAKGYVNTFEITDANYQHAWDKLLKRYDQHKYTVFALVKEFLDQPLVPDANSGNLRRLVSTTDEVIRQLDVLGEQYKSRDPWLIQLLLEKIDVETRALWAQQVVNVDNPSFPDFVKFLEDRCDALETCASFVRQSAMHEDTTKKKPAKPVKPQILSATAELQGQHETAMPVQQVATETQPPVVSSFKADVSSDPSTKITVLPTALIKVRGKNGTFHTVRAMIDSCSGATLISEACMTRLGIHRSNTRFPVTGVAGAHAGTTRGTTQLEIASRFNNEVLLKTQAHVLEVLAPPTPCQTIDSEQMEILEGLPLADPGFNKPGPVDVILGVELFLPILQTGQITDGDGLPVAQRSSLGWLVAGRFGRGAQTLSNLLSLTVRLDADFDQKRHKSCANDPPTDKKHLATRSMQNLNDHQRPICGSNFGEINEDPISAEALIKAEPLATPVHPRKRNTGRKVAKRQRLRQEAIQDAMPPN